LEVDRTPITDLEFDKIKALSKLRVIKAYETAITDKSVAILKDFNNLQSLYLWETQITEGGLLELKEALPNVQIVRGIDPELKDAFIKQDTILDSLQ
ncbi:MAG: hypothetical protein HKM92_00170, partial [Arenibacter sp.]|nr:hypothetical protein [Arenibacter sp.]